MVKNKIVRLFCVGALVAGFLASGLPLEAAFAAEANDLASSSLAESSYLQEEVAGEELLHEIEALPEEELTKGILLEEKAEELIIEEFSSLVPSVEKQQVKKGVFLEQLALPNQILVGTADGEMRAIEVLWKSQPAFSGLEVGRYIFSPTIPEEYVLGEDALLPTICVEVVDEQSIALFSSIAEVTIDESQTVGEIQFAVQAALDQTGIAWVIVHGAKNNANQPLTLSIPAMKSVYWMADYQGRLQSETLVTLEDTGYFALQNTGKLQVWGESSIAVKREAAGSITLEAGTTVSADAGIAAYLDNGSVINVQYGAKVSSDTGTAIYANNSGVTLEGGIVSSKTGTAIDSSNRTVSVMSGTVSSETGTAILSKESNVTLRFSSVYTVSGVCIDAQLGAVTLEQYNVIETKTGTGVVVTGNGARLTVKGYTNIHNNGSTGYGIVANSGTTVTVTNSSIIAQNGGTALYTAGGAVTLTDSRVTAGSSGTAIKVNNQGAVRISGGLVFAPAASIFGVNSVVNGALTIFPDSNAVILGWNEQAGTTNYVAGTNSDIVSIDGVETKWKRYGDTGGIEYQNGANKGFVPLQVDVKTKVVQSDLAFSIPQSNTYNGTKQGIGVVTVKIPDFDGAITVEYNGTTMPINAGVYTVTARVSETDDFFSNTLKLGTFTIGKAPLNVLVENQQVVQGQPLPDPVLRFTGFVAKETVNTVFSTVPSAVHTIQNTSEVGTSAIVFEGSSQQRIENYQLVFMPGTLAVVKKQVDEGGSGDNGNTIPPVSSSNSSVPQSRPIPVASSRNTTASELPASSSRDMTAASSGIVNSASQSERKNAQTPAEASKNPPEPKTGGEFAIAAAEGSLQWENTFLDGVFVPEKEQYSFSALRAGDTVITYTDENGDTTEIPITIRDSEIPTSNIKMEAGFPWWTLVVALLLAMALVWLIILFKRRKNKREK